MLFWKKNKPEEHVETEEERKAREEAEKAKAYRDKCMERYAPKDNTWRSRAAALSRMDYDIAERYNAGEHEAYKLFDSTMAECLNTGDWIPDFEQCRYDEDIYKHGAADTPLHQVQRALLCLLDDHADDFKDDNAILFNILSLGARISYGLSDSFDRQRSVYEFWKSTVKVDAAEDQEGYLTRVIGKAFTQKQNPATCGNAVPWVDIEYALQSDIGGSLYATCYHLLTDYVVADPDNFLRCFKLYFDVQRYRYSWNMIFSTGLDVFEYAMGTEDRKLMRWAANALLSNNERDPLTGIKYIFDYNRLNLPKPYYKILARYCALRRQANAVRRSDRENAAMLKKLEGGLDKLDSQELIALKNMLNAKDYSMRAEAEAAVRSRMGDFVTSENMLAHDIGMLVYERDFQAKKDGGAGAAADACRGASFAGLYEKHMAAVHRVIEAERRAKEQAEQRRREEEQRRREEAQRRQEEEQRQLDEERRQEEEERRREEAQRNQMNYYQNVEDDNRRVKDALWEWSMDNDIFGGF